jgi:hypothetical protein
MTGLDDGTPAIRELGPRTARHSTGRGADLGLDIVARAFPGESGAQGPLFIQTSAPWTDLDGRGNPSTVIVGGALASAEGSALFGL